MEPSTSRLDAADATPSRDSSDVKAESSSAAPTSSASSSVFERFIEDRRDVPFVRLSILLTVLFWPSAIWMMLPGRFHWIHAVVHLAAYVWFLGPFTLMLHNTSHRRLYKKRFAFMNQYIPWFLGPLFGQSPHTYSAHHVGMHHAENNLADDLSTTLPYQRDSVLHFLHYLGTFLTTVAIQLPRYFWRHGRMPWFKKALGGETIFFAFVFALVFVAGWRGPTIAFLVPFAVTRMAMMAGNWAQHAFVSQDKPESPYTNSITCINCTYNERCFNDGYHIGHHVMAARHWTEMPADFEKNKPRYAKEGAIVFEGIDFFIIWALLMMKNYDKLAKHFVDLSGERRSNEEIVALLKSRTQRFEVVPKAIVAKAA